MQSIQAASNLVVALSTIPKGCPHQYILDVRAATIKLAVRDPIANCRFDCSRRGLRQRRTAQIQTKVLLLYGYVRSSPYSYCDAGEIKVGVDEVCTCERLNEVFDLTKAY
jgi:hypothetical protein